ncbi:hypothetical protein KIN20_019739 [Parelaphostrongylus tenuis]|uniref:Uncharacterized protein n=1 Tax=Parelaphostrongylus tenuis TaxID=148309 RepID=A0AAD5QSN8_PARTN|nr:hypothetical protein KIN20_019739 [Parelaphostrongylus tenuis]
MNDPQEHQFVGDHARDNMLSSIQNFIANAPPGCEVEITLKYSLPSDSAQQAKTFHTKVPPTTYEAVNLLRNSACM